MPRYLKCDHGDYESFNIDIPRGLPMLLVKNCIKWHELGHPGHKVKIVEE